MLFGRAIDYNSRDYHNGHLLGMLAAGVICGLWPLFAGLRKGQPLAGVIGFFACIPFGFLAGCLSALPAAFVFKSLIGAMSGPKPPGNDAGQDAPFNPYANGKRSAF
jgi:hypothetical protein